MRPSRPGPPGARCDGVSEYLPFLVIGLATGSVYAIAAMGLTVTYTTSGVFNFAHGAVGMIATFIFYTLRVDF
ncbi:MAG: ABC transporter permease subunit, partial [Acidimicrobiia bacterium]